MGRLWQTLIVSRWNNLFAWLPVETLVKECQEDYYDALSGSDEQGDSTRFIEFMLGMISQTLDDVLTSGNDVGINDGINVGITNAAEAMREQLLLLVGENPSITVKQMASELVISTRQAERIVSSLKQEGKLVRIGANRNGRWEVR